MLNGRLDTGEVRITLNDDELVLKPTLRAATMISRQFSGYAKARQLLVDESFDAAVFIIRVGTNMTEKSARKLEEAVWKNGLDVDILLPLIRYVAILNNGGRPLPMDIDGAFDVLGGDDSRDNDDQNRIEDHRSGDEDHRSGNE